MTDTSISSMAGQTPKQRLDNESSNDGRTPKRRQEKEDSSCRSDSEHSREPSPPRRRRRFSDTSREIRALHEKVQFLSDLLLQGLHTPEPPIGNMPATDPQASVLN